MIDRRTFVAAAGGALWAQTSPSDQMVAGVVGAGSEGKYLLTAFKRNPSVRIGAVCDVYEPHLEAGLSLAGGNARAYRNYKAMLDDKNIQIVIIATPEHWHHRMTLDATEQCLRPGAQCGCWLAAVGLCFPGTFGNGDRTVTKLDPTPSEPEPPGR